MYSATVQGCFVVGDQSYRIAKSNGCTFTLAEPCELAPGTVGELRVTIDGRRHTRWVRVESVDGQAVLYCAAGSPKLSSSGAALADLPGGLSMSLN